MKLPVSWLLEFVNASDNVGEIATRLGNCGFAVESVENDVVDLEITANRPDCLSVYGLAREVATAFGATLAPAADAASHVPVSGHATIPVSVGDIGCSRYALAVANVTVAQSPAWLASRLAAAGVRPINNVVDVTNYVMLELGHPMHAFDVAKLTGPEIHVRRARAGEALTTLDGQRRTLDDTMLVIADKERAIAIAGVMGGAAPEVTGNTTRIALESACFVPQSVRATSRKLGLKTEASARFERGADVNAPVRALLRALALLEQIGAGRVDGGVTDVYPRTAPTRTIALNRARLARLLGATVPDADVERILGSLGFGVSAAADGWAVSVPSFRVDVTREADLVEEVGRHWGFDRIPVSYPPPLDPPRPSTPAVAHGRSVRRLLCGAGLQEAVTFTFIEETAAAPFADPVDRIAIKNPLSEKFGWLRPSLAPGLVEALTYNRNRQTADVRLFEIGTVFSAARGERAHVGWILAGSRDDHWSSSAAPIGFADTKGVAELLAAGSGVTVEVEIADVPWLAKGQSARLLDTHRQPIGWIGRLTVPAIAADAVFGGELDLTALAGTATEAPRPIEPLPRHPSVVRDLSIVVDERLPAAEVRGTIRAHGPATLASVREFDRYQGKGVPQGQVSLSMRLTFRDPHRTLTDAEVNGAVDGIVQALVRTHGVTLRGT